MQYTLLNIGTKMPKIGFGTYSTSGSVLEEALDYAIFAGYRHIDTATLYKNEVNVGSVLEDNINRGKIKRSEIFLTSKLPSVFLHPKAAKQCLEKSLHDLRTPYLDMWLIHHPFGNKDRGDGTLKPVDSDGNRELEVYDLNLTWTAMENKFRDKKARAIGVSNFNVDQMKRIMKKAKIPISNLQLECHVHNQQNNLRHFCREKDIVVTSYSPLGCPTYEERDTSVKSLLEDDSVKQIAQSLKKTEAQILLRFLLELGTVPIPKSSNKNRIVENLNIFDFELRDEHRKKLNSLNKNIKHFRFEWAIKHPEYFKNEF